MKWLWIFLGGGMGAVCRYLLTLFPGNNTQLYLGTLSANFLACGLLGYLIAQKSGEEPSSVYLLLGVGFCGALSTYSTFNAEFLKSIQQQQFGTALLYIALTLVLGTIALWLGSQLGAR